MQGACQRLGGRAKVLIHLVQAVNQPRSKRRADMCFACFLITPNSVCLKFDQMGKTNAVPCYGAPEHSFAFGGWSSVILKSRRNPCCVVSLFDRTRTAVRARAWDPVLAFAPPQTPSDRWTAAEADAPLWCLRWGRETSVSRPFSMLACAYTTALFRTSFDVRRGWRDGFAN